MIDDSGIYIGSIRTSGKTEAIIELRRSIAFLATYLWVTAFAVIATWNAFTMVVISTLWTSRDTLLVVENEARLAVVALVHIKRVRAWLAGSPTHKAGMGSLYEASRTESYTFALQESVMSLVIAAAGETLIGVWATATSAGWVTRETLEVTLSLVYNSCDISKCADWTSGNAFILKELSRGLAFITLMSWLASLAVIRAFLTLVIESEGPLRTAFNTICTIQLIARLTSVALIRVLRVTASLAINSTVEAHFSSFNEASWAGGHTSSFKWDSMFRVFLVTGCTPIIKRATASEAGGVTRKTLLVYFSRVLDFEAYIGPLRTLPCTSAI